MTHVRVGVAKNSNIAMGDNGDIHLLRRWAHNMIISMATYRQQLQDVATKLADIRRSL